MTRETVELPGAGRVRTRSGPTPGPRPLSGLGPVRRAVATGTTPFVRAPRPGRAAVPAARSRGGVPAAALGRPRPVRRPCASCAFQCCPPSTPVRPVASSRLLFPLGPRSLCRGSTPGQRGLGPGWWVTMKRGHLLRWGGRVRGAVVFGGVGGRRGVGGWPAYRETPFVGRLEVWRSVGAGGGVMAAPRWVPFTHR